MSDITYRLATEADSAAVRRCMGEIFEETAGQKTAEFGEALWRWQYAECPSGSIVVMAEAGNVVCGYYHVLLFPMQVRGERVLGAMVQDVGTRREYRKHGIFKQMGAFALERMRAAGAGLIYTFPNNLSLPSFVRNHQYTVVTQAPVRVLPLRTGPILAGRLRLGRVGQGLGALADPVLRMMQRRPGLLAGETVRRETSFTPPLAALAAGAAAETRVSMERTAAYLNWRFFVKPTVSYQLWSLVRAADPIAYLVTRRATMFGTECVLLMDFGFAPGESQGLLRLVSERLVAERGEAASLAVTMGLHPVFASLASLGFLQVPERFNPRTFNLLVKDLTGAEPAELFRGGDWTITLADWDVF